MHSGPYPLVKGTPRLRDGFPRPGVGARCSEIKRAKYVVRVNPEVHLALVPKPAVGACCGEIGRAVTALRTFLPFAAVAANIYSGTGNGWTILGGWTAGGDISNLHQVVAKDMH